MTRMIQITLIFGRARMAGITWMSTMTGMTRVTCMTQMTRVTG